MLPTDSMTLASAVYAGYGWRSRTTGRYTVVSTTSAPVASASPTKCTGTAAGEAGIKTLTINGRVGLVRDITPALPTTMGPGVPIMFFQTITYSFASSSLFPGKIGLWRSVANGVTEELMAPFATTARFRYYQSGDDTSRTTAPALSDIRGIALVLTTEASRKPAGKTTLSQTKRKPSVFFKNMRAP
jgi:hypothetical protein